MALQKLNYVGKLVQDFEGVNGKTAKMFANQDLENWLTNYTMGVEDVTGKITLAHNKNLNAKQITATFDMLELFHSLGMITDYVFLKAYRSAKEE